MYIGEYVPSGYWLTVSFAFVVSFQIRFYFSLISLFFEVASLNEYLIVIGCLQGPSMGEVEQKAGGPGGF